MRKRNWQRKLITVNICFICFRFPVFWFPSFFFFILIAFCFLHKMVASCSFRFKLKWRPRQLAAAIRELCAAQLTQSHPSIELSPSPLSPWFPWLTCYSNMRYVLLQSTEIDFCVFFCATFREKSVESSVSSFSGFMCCDFFFPQLLKPSNSLF